MTLTSSPIQMTRMNFSRNECSSLLYFTLAYANDARWGSRWDARSERSPVPVEVRVRVLDLSDWEGGQHMTGLVAETSRQGEGRATRVIRIRGEMDSSPTS